MGVTQVAFSIQLRRDTSANWGSTNPVLRRGEPGFETDTNKLKIGDGATAWNVLAYINPDVVIPPPPPPAASVPPGAITSFAGITAPTGWLMCNGVAVSRTTYADLFTTIGTLYGQGNGSSTFNLPNLLGRIPVGFTGADFEFNAMGKTGGSKTHALTQTEMPRHTHIQDSHNHTQNSHGHSVTDSGHNHSPFSGRTAGYNANSFASGNLSGWRNTGSGDSTSTSTTGISVSGNTATNQAATAVNQFSGGTGTTQAGADGAAHNNLQPYIALNYIIKT
jgi:microcystin-dependent protein